MTRKKTTTDSKQLAREYIDRIIAINQRHGMGGKVSEETYNQAIEKAERALTVKGASPH